MPSLAFQLLNTKILTLNNDKIDEIDTGPICVKYYESSDGPLKCLI